ncbi:hypothetical protein D3C71_1193820 [compost metagenome]
MVHRQHLAHGVAAALQLQPVAGGAGGHGGGEGVLARRDLAHGAAVQGGGRQCLGVPVHAHLVPGNRIQIARGTGIDGGGGVEQAVGRALQGQGLAADTTGKTG